MTTSRGRRTPMSCWRMRRSRNRAQALRAHPPGAGRNTMSCSASSRRSSPTPTASGNPPHPALPGRRHPEDVIVEPRPRSRSRRGHGDRFDNWSAQRAVAPVVAPRVHTVRPSSGPAGATARQRLARGLGTSGQRLRIGAPRRITLVTLLVAGVGAAA